MSKKARKAVILTLKIAISIALLAWVLKDVSWQDFVMGADGRHVAVQTMQPSGEGTFSLTKADGGQEVLSASVLRPVNPKGGVEVANYLRPGFLTVIRGLSVPLLVISGLLAPLQLIVIGFRWWRLLHVQDIRITYREVLRLTWLGTFFNYIVLGTTGGDLIKAWYASRHTPHKTECLVTVFLDRLVGLIGLTLLSSVMLAIVLSCRALGAAGVFASASAGTIVVLGFKISGLKFAVFVAAFVLACLLGLGAVSFSQRLRHALRLNKIYSRLPMRNQLSRVGDSLRLFRHRLGSLGKAMGQTLCVHLMFVLSIGLAGASLHLHIPWYQYVIYIPLIYIIAAVPIVPGGVGLAESLYVTFFAVWADQSQILALALLARLVPMFWALPGIIVAITGPKLPPTDQIQAEMSAGQDDGDAPAAPEILPAEMARR